MNQPREDTAFAILAEQFGLHPSEDDPCLRLASDVAPVFKQAGLTTYDALAEHRGEKNVQRHRHHWNTMFTLTDADGRPRTFYIKCRQDRSWLRLLLGRPPQSTAAEEMTGIARVRGAGIATVRPVAVGLRRLTPWLVESMFISEALPGNAATATNYVPKRFGGDLSRADLNAKRDLIRRAADLVARLHAAGLNHRDLYCIHLLINTVDHGLSLIDLHRVQRRRPGAARLRWVAKDLAQLVATVPNRGVTRTDLARFWRRYRDHAGFSPMQLKLLYHWTRLRTRHQRSRTQRSARKARM